jgi:hypothetical protein
MMNGGTGGASEDGKIIESKKDNGMSDSGVLGSIGE